MSTIKFENFRTPKNLIWVCPNLSVLKFRISKVVSLENMFAVAIYIQRHSFCSIFSNKRNYYEVGSMLMICITDFDGKKEVLKYWVWDLINLFKQNLKLRNCY